MFCKGWPLISASITIPLSATYLYTGEAVVPRQPTPHKNLLRHGKRQRTQVSLNWLFMLLWNKGLNYVIAEGLECCLGLIILADDHHQIIFPIYGSPHPHSGCPPTTSNSDSITEGFQEKTSFLVGIAQIDTFWTFNFLQNQCKYS